MIRARRFRLETLGRFGRIPGGRSRPPLYLCVWGQAALGRLRSGGKDKAEKTADEGWAVVSRAPGNAMHEHVHHLQATLPSIDRLFQQLHRKRTIRPDGTRDPVVRIEDYGSAAPADLP